MNPQEKKEKMLELIKKKQSGGRSKDMEAPKNVSNTFLCVTLRKDNEQDKQIINARRNVNSDS